MKMQKVTLRKKVEQTIRANARRGARALDKLAPDEWFKHHSGVVLHKLEMQNGCNCVWGQLSDKVMNDAFQDAYYHVEQAVSSHDPSLGYFPGSGFGFVSPELLDRQIYTAHYELAIAIKNEEWRVLQDEWEKQIRLRRRNAGLRAAA